ncbi:MAG: acetylxylan esterase [Clostridia bacterium]|nr:acetylxylan esterase [Clostridia bacterium]
MKDMILKRNLPSLLTKEEMLEILQREEYGFMPPPPDKISFEKKQLRNDNVFAGKGKLWEITIKCTIGEKEFSFPVSLMLPEGTGPFPFFVNINFEKNVPNYYFPAEEILDNGFAAFNLYFNDVTADNGDFTDGLAGIFYPDGKRKPQDCGKIAMWAWAASRCLDYAETEKKLDMKKAAVCGHSRLGKTALLAGASDPRFRFVHSNDSGCSGAAIARENTGETIRDIHRSFYYWFCENYRKYIDNEENMPFDQHFLLACISPNFVSVGSASEDDWANPMNEQLSCFAASPAFEKEGLKGFICNKQALVGDKFFEGNIGYFLRKGKHFFSREDWNNIFEFIRSKN